MDLSIIVVNYNTKDLTKQTIDSVINTTNNTSYEIILIDNASTDGSKEYFSEVYNKKVLEIRHKDIQYYNDNEEEQKADKEKSIEAKRCKETCNSEGCAKVKSICQDIKYIYNEENLGFAKANNQAMKISKGRYVLLLNSDTIVKEDCIEKCIEYMDMNKTVGALGPKILLGNGELDHACKRGFPTPTASLYYMLGLDKKHPNEPKYGQYQMTHLSNDEINEVDALTGAFMMVRKEVIDTVGVFDERFFMYGEDLDWCYRIKEAAWKIVYYPEALIIHLKGQSSKKKRKYKTIYQFHKTMIQFYNKHYMKKYNVFVTLAVYVGVMGKMSLSMVKNFFR